MIFSAAAFFSTMMATCSSQPSFDVSSLLCSMRLACFLRYLKNLRLLWMAVAEMMKWISSPMPASSVSRIASTPSFARAASPVLSVPMNVARLSQTTFAPPKNGRVRRAWMVSRQILFACSALSAFPSMISLEKSFSSDGLTWLNSLVAASATAPSSVPWMRWMFGLAGIRL